MNTQSIGVDSGSWSGWVSVFFAGLTFCAFLFTTIRGPLRDVEKDLRDQLAVAKSELKDCREENRTLKIYVDTLLRRIALRNGNGPP